MTIYTCSMCPLFQHKIECPLAAAGIDRDKEDKECYPRAYWRTLEEKLAEIKGSVQDVQNRNNSLIKQVNDLTVQNAHLQKRR